jgi:hypothetical protein
MPASPHHDSPPPPTAQIKRRLACQLPPRAFFGRMCDGLSLGEALGVLAWLGLNAWWLGLGLRRSLGRSGMSAVDKLDK